MSAREEREKPLLQMRANDKRKYKKTLRFIQNYRENDFRDMYINLSLYQTNLSVQMSLIL